MGYDHWLRAEKGLGTSHYYGFQGKRRGGERGSIIQLSQTQHKGGRGL